MAPNELVCTTRRTPALRAADSRRAVPATFTSHSVLRSPLRMLTIAAT